MKILFDLVTTATPPGSVIYNKNWGFSIPAVELEKRAKALGWNLQYETRQGRNFAFYGKRKAALREKELYEFAGEIVADKVIVRCCPMAGWGPAVDRGHPEVIKYFTAIAEYYIKEYDIDGWRIDAPGDNWNSRLFPGEHSSAKLLTSVKTAITKIKPEAAFLSEGGLPEKTPSELVYVGPGGLAFYVMGEKVPSQNFVEKIKEKPEETLLRRAWSIESHDTIRIITKYPQANKSLLCLMATLPGVPMIQAGQEIGAENAFWSKPPVDWSKENNEIRKFYKKVLRIRNNSNALKYGTIKDIWKCGDNIYAYLRSYENENVVVVINFNSNQVISVLSIPFKKGDTLKDELSDESFTVDDPSDFQIILPAYGSRVLVLKEDSL